MLGRARAARGVLLVALAFLVVPGQADARPGGKLVPAEGVLLGAYLDRWGSEPYANVTAFEALIGRRLDIDHRFWAWNDGWPYFGAEPYHYERWDVEGGRIPMVSWDYLGAGTLDAILNGSHDALIRSKARAVAQFGQPLFVRWGYEMNGSWMPWSGYQNGRSAAKFVDAWRRLHDIFASEGATNAVWVWAPNAQSNPNEPWNDFRNYYPGDEYVDWVGIDGYNFGTSEPWSRWESFAAIVRPVYSAYADRKPIMIAEVGSTEQGGSKAEWLLAAKSAVENEFPSVAAFVYFNYDHGGYDWELTSSSSALQAFRALAADSSFNPTGVPVEPAPAAYPAGVAVRARGVRRTEVRRTVLTVGRTQPCPARRTPFSCRFGTEAGVHALALRISTRLRAPRRLTVGVGLSGYWTNAVVFRRGRRIVCVDRSAPYRCLIAAPRGRATIRLRFLARTSLPRQAVARVRVVR